MDANEDLEDVESFVEQQPLLSDGDLSLSDVLSDFSVAGLDGTSGFVVDSNNRSMHPVTQPLVPNVFFLLERHLAQVAWLLSVLSLSLFTTSRPRLAVSLRPKGHWQYHYTTTQQRRLASRAKCRSRACATECI